MTAGKDPSRWRDCRTGAGVEEVERAKKVVYSIIKAGTRVARWQDDRLTSYTKGSSLTFLQKEIPTTRLPHAWQHHLLFI